MASSHPVLDFDIKAPDFTLPGTDGKSHALADLAGSKGTVIMFICNHCPYVLAVIDRLVRDVKTLQDMRIGVAAICSNDARSYPADSFDKMGEMARKQGFTFPYLHDEDQSVARAYDAACTPEFHGFNADLQLQYRGRLDAGRMGAVPDNLRRDLVEAMTLIAKTGRGPDEQHASMGCSIKWKAV
ncbi:MAG: thioredoxin family protein [Pseudomonadota bacterium]